MLAKKEKICLKLSLQCLPFTCLKKHNNYILIICLEGIVVAGQIWNNIAIAIIQIRPHFTAVIVEPVPTVLALALAFVTAIDMDSALPQIVATAAVNTDASTGAFSI